MVINKSIRNLILFIFYHEQEIKNLILEKRLDPQIQKTGGGGRAFVSNPTESQAIRDLMPIASVVFPSTTRFADAFVLKKPETWIEIIDRIYDLYKDSSQWKIYDMKFHKGMSDEEICTKLNISKQTFYLCLNDIIRFAHGYGEGSKAIPKRRWK